MRKALIVAAVILLFLGSVFAGCGPPAPVYGEGSTDIDQGRWWPITPPPEAPEAPDGVKCYVWRGFAGGSGMYGGPVCFRAR